MNGVSIKNGDYIGFVGDKIYSDDEDKNRAAEKLLEAAGASERGLMLVFTGENTTEEEAEEIKNHISERYPETETIVIEGDQPVYDYMFVLE